MKKAAVMLIIVCYVFLNLISYAENHAPDQYEVYNTFQYVYDFSDVIDEAVEAEIMINNYYLEKACRSQIVVIALDHTAIPLKEYAEEVFNKLGVGDSVLNNGLLLVMAIEDDDYWLTTGGDVNAGINKLYTTDEIKEDFNAYLEDYFSRKEYSSGVKRFFETLFWRVSNIYGVDIPYYRVEAIYQ